MAESIQQILAEVPVLGMGGSLGIWQGGSVLLVPTGPHSRLSWHRDPSPPQWLAAPAIQTSMGGVWGL